jgi:hypothetical protein
LGSEDRSGSKHQHDRRYHNRGRANRTRHRCRQSFPHGGGGLYWAVAGLVFVYIAAAHNAWVLLVEILR